MSSQIYLCRIHDNSVSKLFQEENGGTLCDEVTHQKAISQKASLLFFCEIISFFTIGPYGLPDITLQNQRKECSQTASWSLSYMSVRWTHISERRFSESFFHVLNGWNFLYQHRPQCNLKKPFSCSSRTVLIDSSMKHKCNFMGWIHTSTRRFKESFFLFFNWVYFLCHCKLHWDKRYPTADFQKT